MYCCRRTSHRVHLPHRDYKCNAFNNQRWIDPRRKKSQKGQIICVFTTMNPMDDDQSMEEILCDLDKRRIAPYKNTWKPHQNTVYWCNLKLAQKRGLQFTKHDRTQQFSTTHCLRFVLRNGMHEDEGGVIPQGFPISKIATCCTASEVAKWTTGSTRTRRKNIL